MKTIKLALVNMHPSFYPNLGLGYLVAYVKKYLSHKVNIQIIEGKKNLANRIKGVSADIIGFTASSCFYPDSVYCIRSIRSFFNGPILLGGPHIASLPKTLPPEVNAGIIGEGEQTLCDLLHVFVETGKLNTEVLSSINGISFHDGGKVSVTPRRLDIELLDSIPFPDRNAFDMKRYLKPHNILENYQYLRGTSILTSRGCPYKCIFCQPTIMWDKMRMHSAEYVVEEIQYLYDTYGLEAIAIVDDLFISSKKRVEQVVRGLSRNKILGKIKYRVEGRANLMDDELMKILKAMNVVQIELGLESGNNRVLQYLKGNNVSVEDNKRAISLAKKYGMGVYGLVMVGSPGETKEEMMDTLKLLEDPQINTCSASKTIPFPGTKLWSEAQADRFITNLEDWKKLTTTLEKGSVYINEKVPYDEFKIIFKMFEDLKGRKRIKNTYLNLSSRYVLKAIFTPGKLVRFIGLLVKYILSKANSLFRRQYYVINSNDNEEQNQIEKLSMVYFLEKEFKTIPLRPHLSAMGKFCKLLCINPPISIDTLFRKPGAFFNWLKKNKVERYDSLIVYTPFAFSSYGISDAIYLFKPINRYIVSRMVKRIIDKLGLKNILWAISYPQQDYMLKFFSDNPVLYFIRDLIAAMSSPRRFKRMQKKENEIIKKVSVVFTTSEKLYNLKKVYNPMTYYSPNGADMNNFSNQHLYQSKPADIAGINNPKVGYVGSINDFLDLKLLNDIAQGHPDWALILIGRIEYDRPKSFLTDLKQFIKVPNVHYLGVKTYEELPDYVRALDVCMTPMIKCLWTEYFFPNKLVQYIAAGKPVVSTDYPVVRLFNDVVKICKTHKEFIIAIEKYISDGDNKGEIKRRMDFARKYDVSHTGFEKIKILESVLAK